MFFQGNSAEGPDAAAGASPPAAGSSRSTGSRLRQAETGVAMQKLSGWDFSAPAGQSRFLTTVPVATNRNGSPIMGPNNEELVVDIGTTSTPPLSSWYRATEAARRVTNLLKLSGHRPTRIAHRGRGRGTSKESMAQHGRPIAARGRDWREPGNSTEAPAAPRSDGPLGEWTPDRKGRKRWGTAGPVHDRARLSLY